MCIRPADPRLHWVIPATLGDARAATQWVDSLCGRFTEEERALYVTAIMELLVNVVKHSYREAPGATISLRVIPGPHSIELIIEDSGIGMPPDLFAAAPSEVKFDPADRSSFPESGLGLAIVKAVMDTVEYARDHGVNRLTAVRRWVR
jgi:anti-sigma regulatory factor (Ser/Thr protein kinase)